MDFNFDGINYDDIKYNINTLNEYNIYSYFYILLQFSNNDYHPNHVMSVQ